MRQFTRRRVSQLSLGALSTVLVPNVVRAAPKCAVGTASTFVPAQLQVSCASRDNFHLFRRFPNMMGLAGVVCRNTCDGQRGTIAFGTLILFPWLKTNVGPKRARELKASIPDGSSAVPTQPIPNPFLPQDEYLCRVVLQAPYQNFIGFTVDATSASQPPGGSTSTISLAPDGMSIAIDWASANLNQAWFGGNRTIPNQDACQGRAWRSLITDALQNAASKAC